MQKNIIKLIILSIFVIICTSCAKVNYSMIINCDETAFLTYYVQIDESTIDLKLYTKIFENVTLELEGNGFVIEKNPKGITATKYIENIFTMSDWDSLLKTDNKNIFSVKNGVLSKEYELNANIDLTGYSATAKEINLDKELKELIDIGFKLVLPSKPIENNATKVNGKSLSWELNYGENNEIHAKYSVIDTGAIVAIIIALVVFAVMLVLGIYIVKKDKSKLDVDKFNVEEEN